VYPCCLWLPRGWLGADEPAACPLLSDMAEWFADVRPRRADSYPESIYSLLPEKQVVMEKPPMYRSIHSGLCPPTGSTFCTKSNAYNCGIYNLGGSTDADPSQRKPYQSHKLKRNQATMGAARVARSAPSDFLRKSTGTMSLPPPGNFKYADEAKKPSVPRSSDQPVHGLTTSKNFITSNAIENILAEPPKLKEYGSDQFLYKKEFGAVPTYLRRMKARHGAMMESLQQQEMERIQKEQDRVKLLSADERGHIVRQLKAKWDSVNEQYQKSSTLDLKKLDTMGKVRRKEQYEAELQQLESYIDRLASKRHVFVTA